MYFHGFARPLFGNIRFCMGVNRSVAPRFSSWSLVQVPEIKSWETSCSPHFQS
jgi:hypothetical protein